MEQIRRELLESISEDNLRRRDRRNNTILLALGSPIVAVLLYAAINAVDVIPFMWGELAVIVMIGLLYNYAIKKHSIDLRLGLIYTSSGILVSLPLQTLGILTSGLVAPYIPFPFETSAYFVLLMMPAGVFVLVAFKISEPIGLRVAKSQWHMMHPDSAEINEEYLNRNALFLAEKRWTNSYFYLFLFLFVEGLPAIILNDSPFILLDTIFVVGFLSVLIWRAYHILKRGKYVFLCDSSKT
jgi:hypothetical protein